MRGDSWLSYRDYRLEVSGRGGGTGDLCSSYGDRSRETRSLPGLPSLPTDSTYAWDWACSSVVECLLSMQENWPLCLAPHNRRTGVCVLWDFE